MTDPISLHWKDFPGAPDHGFILASLNDIPDAGAHLMSTGNGAQPYKIILLRSGQDVFAYMNRCAHFGVPLASKVAHLYAKPNTSITCSVHYARYRWHDGVCEQGECVGERLIKIPVVVVSGNVVVAGLSTHQAPCEPV